jgi:nucleoside-diphosphate-sugar epimerase
MKKVLVTGGSGFIGGRLAESFLKKGDSVRLLLRDEASAESLLKLGAEGFRGDLTRPETLRGALQGIEEVYHAAARLGRWKDTPADIRRVNVEGTKNLLELSASSGIRLFLLVSSAIVTGPVLNADETYPCKPHTLYEETKYESEKLAIRMAAERGVPLTVARPTWTYGPGDPHKLALYRAIRKRRFVLLGRGRNFTHPVFIDDLVEGIHLAAGRPPASQIYNLGGPRHVTTAELTEKMALALGVPPIRMSMPVWLARAGAPVAEKVSDLIGIQLPLTRSRVVLLSCSFTYSIQKARNTLGYNPKVDLEEGFRRTVAWYRENRLIGS